MSCGLHGAGRCAAFIGRAQRRDARLQCRGTATILTCVCTRPATDRWAHGGGTARHVLPRDGSHSQATGAKGNQLLVPRGSGACPARTPRRWNVSRAAQGRQAERRRAGGALERGRAVSLAGQPYFDRVVWTSLGPLPRWVPRPTTRWAPGTTRLALHGT
jgi:hypothetical protein